VPKTHHVESACAQNIKEGSFFFLARFQIHTYTKHSRSRDSTYVVPFTGILHGVLPGYRQVVVMFRISLRRVRQNIVKIPPWWIASSGCSQWPCFGRPRLMALLWRRDFPGKSSDSTSGVKEQVHNSHYSQIYCCPGLAPGRWFDGVQGFRLDSLPPPTPF